MKEQMGQLGYKNAEPLKPFYELPVDRKKFITMLEAGGSSIKETNITPLDYKSTPTEFDQAKTEKMIATALEIKIEDIEKNLGQISECLRDAKNFIIKYLKQNLPGQIQKINDFKDIKELIDFISKTKTISKEKAMTYSPFYCAIVSLMLTNWEYQKEKFQNLINETKYLDQKLFETEEGSPSYFNFLKMQKDPSWSKIAIFTDQDDLIQASYSYRGKSAESTKTKLAKTPELDANEAINDGMGLKFEAGTVDDIEKLVKFLAEHFSDKFGAKKLTISNIGNLFEEKDLKKMANGLKGCEIAFSGFKNPSSNKRWRAVKLEGEIEIPENGEEGRLIKRRYFEVQITLVDNNNESGFSRHEIYKNVQKLSVYTRLFGSFTEEYLDLICQEAAEESGLNKNNIKNYIIKHFLVKIKAKEHRGFKYASKEHVKRWQKTGLMPQEIQLPKNLD
ncbi:MAG: hypothetical protein PHT51_04535 [Patescibacteria group bacterium]|nr:hypothetical protein [Patescibacteria group bacterium]